jgi:hypothetical protein
VSGGQAYMIHVNTSRTPEEGARGIVCQTGLFSSSP